MSVLSECSDPFNLAEIHTHLVLGVQDVYPT